MTTPFHSYLAAARAAGCPADQIRNFERAGLVLQPRQLAASAAARRCDSPAGPTALAYGGARGGGKSFWLLAQIGADDCQRVPGLKCLLLRKVGKANLENFEDLRQRLFIALPHHFAPSRHTLTFPNGSRIIAGHYQTEKDIDNYLGLEYDIIAIEEATTLTHRKYLDISTCCRSSKPNWRPRIYSTSNPGGIGHAWYKKLFIDPHYAQQRASASPLPVADDVRSLQSQPARRASPLPLGEGQGEGLHTALSTLNLTPGQGEGAFLTSDLRPLPSVPAPHSPTHSLTYSPTLFIPARVDDNRFNNPEYRKVLEGLTGWQKRAWLDGDWDIAAGQYFTNFRREIHVIEDFDDTRAVEWWAAFDYGFTHYTVALLGCRDGDGNIFVVDEHAARLWLPQRHAAAIKAMLARHGLVPKPKMMTQEEPGPWGRIKGYWLMPRERMVQPKTLARFVAGADVFSRQSDGTTIAAQYAQEGITLRCANTDRVNGWAEILQRLGEPGVNPAEGGTPPTLFIHQRCARLIETLPALQHDPNRPEDVLKVDADEDGTGGDDAADCLRYLVATKAREVVVRKLRGV